MENLITIVTLLVALSLASERLVEIIKGIIPKLHEQQSNAYHESFRKSIIQALAVGAGILTAILAKPAIIEIVEGPWESFPGIIALGLLASGGSALWNSILSYLLQIKNIRKNEADRLRSLNAQSSDPQS